MSTHSRASVVVISGHRHHSLARVVAAILDGQNKGTRAHEKDGWSGIESEGRARTETEER